MKQFRNFLWGIVFIIIGLILAGNALGYTDINLFFDGWWTLFIIIPCFIDLFKEKNKTGNFIGVLIGVVILLCCQGVLDFGMMWKLLFPAILIVIGISFIFKDTMKSKIAKEIKKLSENRVADNVYCATFAGQNINFENQEITGVDLTAVFGGIKCDMRKAFITQDIIVNASATFGGIDIYVPSNVKVKIKSVPIFGGVSDKSAQITDENSHTIYINAQSVFGGVEIK